MHAPKTPAATAPVPPSVPSSARFATNDPRPAQPLQLGQAVVVELAPGMALRNCETGAPFAPGTPTSQRVTVTLLKRLADGDLVLLQQQPA